MGRQAEVLSTKNVVTDDGVPVAEVTCDPYDAKALTAQHFAPPGVDSLPLPGDFVHLAEGQGTGNEEAVGYHDTKNAGKAHEGECRLYARNAQGVLVCELWLQLDGTIDVKSIGPGSKIRLNGVEIDQAGNITAPGEITAHAATPATAVRLGTHIHPTGTGPSGPPQPGT